MAAVKARFFGISRHNAAYLNISPLPISISAHRLSQYQPAAHLNISPLRLLLFPAWFGSWEPIRGAENAAAIPIEHVGVPHRRRDVSVAEQFLHDAKVIAIFQ